MNFQRSIVLTASVVWGCQPLVGNALPVPNLSLAAPIPLEIVTVGSTGPLDADGRATNPLGQQFREPVTGSKGLKAFSAGLIGGSASAGVTVLLTSAPSIHAAASAEDNGTVLDTVLPIPGAVAPFGADVAIASGSLRYQFEIFDPSPVSKAVNLNIDGTIGAAASLLGAASASIDVTDLAGKTIVGDFLNLNGTTESLRHAFVDGLGVQHFVDDPNYSLGTYHESGTYQFHTNQAYSVGLFALAGATIYVHSGSNLAKAAAESFADPVFTLVGSNTENLTLVFSDGIGNTLPKPVPVPAALWLFSSALGAISIHRRRSS